MKVELQCGDTIAIPDGCKATIKDGSVTIEKEVQEFNDGDVLCSVCNSTMVIFKEMHKDNSNRFYTHYNTNHSSNEKWNKDAFRLATEEEKQLLFDKMKEQRLRWNADKKCIEKLRWRAKLNERYYFFDEYLNVKFDRDENFEMDILRWGVGNYFETADETREAAKRVREILRKYRNGVS